MPVYKLSMKAEVHVVLKGNKPLDDKLRAIALLQLEQHVNAQIPVMLHLEDEGAAVQAHMRLHLKELK